MSPKEMLDIIDNKGWDEFLCEAYHPSFGKDLPVYSDLLEMYYCYHKYMRHRNHVYNWLEKEVYNVGSGNQA